MKPAASCSLCWIPACFRPCASSPLNDKACLLHGTELYNLVRKAEAGPRPPPCFLPFLGSSIPSLLGKTSLLQVNVLGVFCMEQSGLHSGVDFNRLPVFPAHPLGRKGAPGRLKLSFVFLQTPPTHRSLNCWKPPPPPRTVSGRAAS